MNTTYTAFLHPIKKMSIEESDVKKIIAEVEATSWRVRECIQVRELAATQGECVVCGCSRSKRPESERSASTVSRS